MLEIYNETIRDLLVISKPDAQKTDAAKLQNIKHDTLGNTYIADLTLVEVSNWKEVSTLLRQAAHCRWEAISFFPCFLSLLIHHTQHGY